MFSEKGRCRRFAIRLMQHAYFEQGTLCMIMLYSIILVLDTGKMEHMHHGSYNYMVLYDLSHFISYFFLVETVIRIIGCGFVLNKHSYLRDGFNCFDFVLVLTIIVQNIFQIVEAIEGVSEAKS